MLGAWIFSRLRSTVPPIAALFGAGLALSAAAGCDGDGSQPDRQGADGSVTPSPDPDAGGPSGGNGGGDGGQATGEACGSTTCPPGQVCCNESCGICTEPGGACIEIACIDGGPPGGGNADAGSGTGGGGQDGGSSGDGGGSGEDAGQGVSCGSTTCPPGQVCCNESCGICTEPGGLCTQQQCVGDGGLGFPTPTPGPTPIPDPIGPDSGTVSWDGGTSDRTVVTGRCARTQDDNCSTDADCTTGGCGGELCYNSEGSGSGGGGVSTCDCTAPNANCGCVDGTCAWYE